MRDLAHIERERQMPADMLAQELAVQPIEGKTYLADRKGDQLSVTDMSGAIPPRSEYLLAMESLDSVGRPNPLSPRPARCQIAPRNHGGLPCR